MKPQQAPKFGDNRTGIHERVDDAKAMQQDMDAFLPSSTGSRAGPGLVRVRYARDGAPVGSVPRPANVKKAARMNGDKRAALFADKLGERLGFERSGVRLYEALVSKHEAFGGFDGGPTREDLVHVLEEEHDHFKLLAECIARMGGDPTAITPSADLAALASSGVMKVIVDARTSLLQALEAMLVAELADKDGWEVLTELARAAGHDDLAERFARCERTEQDHLDKVHRWLRAGQQRGR